MLCNTQTWNHTWHKYIIHDFSIWNFHFHFQMNYIADWDRNTRLGEMESALFQIIWVIFGFHCSGKINLFITLNCYRLFFFLDSSKKFQLCKCTFLRRKGSVLAQVVSIVPVTIIVQFLTIIVIHCKYICTVNTVYTW